MESFTLTGEGIDVRFSADDGVLSVQGEGLAGTDREFSGENVLISGSDLGTMLTVVLLDSSRDLTQVRLAVLVPSGIRDSEEEQVTGAAIIVTDRTRSMGPPRSPLQDYDVRPLSGTMQNRKTELAQ
ncbi:hypothetical protein [Arthrobacter mobilis]|uniref:Uncharacterized protein n=1 Tax=Arthrobacter mobilis TaxID=2724944 RepID=A0A7X6HGK0_9MICC|nr:hypothetical protein [Arthrobacter mobilis]NKX55829.1 hypothetical protein [Arthrobacter mobilis]